MSYSLTFAHSIHNSITTPVLATKNNYHCYYNCYSTKTSRRTNKIVSCQNKEYAEGGHSSLSSALTLSHKNPQDVITSTDMVVDNGIKTTSTTAAIMPLLKPSDGIGIVSYVRGKNYLITGATGFLGKAQDRPQVSLEDRSFLEKIFQKSELKERSWADLVNLKTICWHCDGLEPSPEAEKYEKQVRKQMDEAKRRAIIKQQAAARKKDAQATGTGVPKPPVIKRKPNQEIDRLPKKAKVTPETVVGLEAEVKKVPVKHRKGKGLMTGGPGYGAEKPPVLLCEDSRYAIEKLSSIITADDYADLGNHSTEAIGETGLFSLAQAVVTMKGLMDHCVHQETALGRLLAKPALTEDELSQHKVYKVKMDKKLSICEEERAQLEKQTEKLQMVLANKEKENLSVKDQLRQAKDDAIKEYRDSDVYLTELGGTFADGFDDAVRQVKALYPELDLSKVGIDEAQALTSILPEASGSTDQLFGEDQDAKVAGSREDGVAKATQESEHGEEEEVKAVDSLVE